MEVKDWNFASNISMGEATISNPQPQPYPCPNPHPHPILTLTLSLALTLALTVTRQGQDLPQRVQGHGGQGDAPRPRERQPRRHTRQCDMVPALVVAWVLCRLLFESAYRIQTRGALYANLTAVTPLPKHRHRSARSVSLCTAPRRLDRVSHTAARRVGVEVSRCNRIPTR